MNTFAEVLSPPLLAVFAVLSLGFGGLLFFMARRSDACVIDSDAPLSWAEPVEVRLVLYLLLAAICGTLALVFRLIFGFLSGGSFGAGLLLLLTAFLFVGNLLFLYAALGSLLQGALGTRGRPPFWLWRFLSPIDGFIMDAGDILARIFFHPAPPYERRRRRRSYDYDDEYDYDRPPRARRGGGRTRYVDDDEYEFDRPAPRRRDVGAYRDEPERPARRPAYPEEPVREVRRPTYADEPVREARRPSYAEDVEYAADEYEPPDDSGLPQGRTRRTRGSAKRDMLRERLELAIRDYESALSAPQREKLREMRGIIESIRQLE